MHFYGSNNQRMSELDEGDIDSDSLSNNNREEEAADYEEIFIDDKTLQSIIKF
jgi:hypothetical protein